MCDIDHKLLNSIRGGGAYVLAVSGGVDSAVLLHAASRVAAQHPGQFRFVVAHVDHNVREDSLADAALVAKLAGSHDFDFAHTRFDDLKSRDEAYLRQRRYEFLHSIAQRNRARIITAHHNNDALETVVMAVQRGTNRRGLSSLQTTRQVLRPFLDLSKDHIMAYANDNELTWREDSTNADNSYARNAIRNESLPALEQHLPEIRESLREIYSSSIPRNIAIDTLLQDMLDWLIDDGENGMVAGASVMNRSKLALLPKNVASECLVFWLRSQLGHVELNKKQIEIMRVFALTARPGKKLPLNRDYTLIATNSGIRQYRNQ